MIKQISHTCEEGGANLRISLLHLLITWKTTIYLKNCWSGPMKNVRILIFTMLYLKKKNKEKYLRYHYFTPVYQTSQLYDLQILKYRVWQTEIGNCESFLALLPPKNPSLEIIIKNFEKMKKIAGDVIILSRSYIKRFVWYNLYDSTSLTV